MFRTNSPTAQHLNIFFDNGGLGDSIARLPIVPWICAQFPHMHLHLFFHDYFVPVAKNALANLSHRVTIHPWSNAKSDYNTVYYSKSFAQSIKGFDNLSYHMTEHAFAAVCNKQPGLLSDYNYPQLDLAGIDLSRFPLPAEYVVVTTAFTAPAREFAPEHVNALVDLILASGHKVVFLGQKQTVTGTEPILGKISQDIDFSKGLDLIDKTSLLEAAKVLGNAKAVVGLDNGLIHLAAAANQDLPIVAGFTSVDPAHRAPYRRGILGHQFYDVAPRHLECFGCQSNMIFTPSHDFRRCLYEDYKCVKELTAELYWQKLRDLL